jgi:hypothetical protein
MGWLFKSNNKVPTRAAGITLQTSVYGKPVAIIYGTTRVSGNMLLYGNFNAALVNQGQGSGKGGLFSPSNAGSQSYNYSAAFAFALGEGPINGIGTVWKDKKLKTLAQEGFTLFTGTYPQSAWGTSVSWKYKDASGSTISGTAAPLGYNGIAYVADASFNLGNNTSIPNLQFEVKGILSTSVGSTAVFDADPSQILTDILTNTHYGLGFPSARIGDLSAWQNYCFATGLLVSPAYDTQRTGADIITELAMATNSAPVWSSGVLTMVSYGDTTISGNGKTFTPSLTPIYALGDNDFLPSPQSAGSLGGASGPVVMIRKRPSDKINSIKVEYLNRAANYAPAIAYANDQALIDLYGTRTNGSQQFHLFCDGTAANLSTRLQLRRQRVSNTYQFDLDARYVLLDPMDIVSLTDTNLGLSNQLVRITGIQENDDGTFSFTAEEVLSGTGSAPLYNFSTHVPYNSNPATVAGNVNTPIIIEPPSAVFAQGGPPQIWIGASSTDVTWGGANVWLSLDNTNYTLVGQIIGAARQGTLTVGCSNYTGSNPDNTDTLSVDLTTSLGTLQSGSALDAALGHTLCLVDSELLSFQTATLTAANMYNLTVLYRGLYGTLPNGHLTGANFTRLDNAIFKYVLPPQYINQTVFVKLQSFNLYGDGLQDLSTATAYQFIPGGLGMVHPLAQAINVGVYQDLGSVTTIANVFEDYGFIVATVSGATAYYFPQAVDMQQLVSSFSLSFVQASSQYLSFTVPTSGGVSAQQGVLHEGASLWFKRSALGDSEMLWGSYVSTATYVVIRFDASNFLHFQWMVGGTTIAHITSTIAIADTSSWHQVLWTMNTSTFNPTSSDKIRLIQDGVTLSNSASIMPSTLTGVALDWSTGGSRSTLGGLSGAITLGGPGIASTFNYFSGQIAVYYYIDDYKSIVGSSVIGTAQLTSTMFMSGTPGFPVQFTGSSGQGFIGQIDAQLTFFNALTNSTGNLLLGSDISGENNNYNCFGGMTSTNQSQDYP